MARTDKDLPYDVKVRREGTIKHDHISGVCLVGTWKESKVLRQGRHRHMQECPRYIRVSTCIHDYKRVVLQKAVEQARARQGGYYPNTYAAVARNLPSEAIWDMLDAGRIPNCREAKTHQINVEDIDLHFHEGESLQAAKRYGPYRYGTPEIVRVRYDSSIHCKVCEEFQDITCFIEERRGERRWGCDCWGCNNDKDLDGERSAQRDENRKRTREYNTFRDTE